MARAAIVACLVVLVGCGGSGSTLAQNGAGGSGGAGATATTGSGTESSSATDTSGAGGGSTTTTSGAGGGAPAVLWPLAVGYSWTYDVTAVGLGGTCGAGQGTSTVLDSVQLDGKDAFELSTWCDGIPDPVYFAPGAGSELYYHQDALWHLQLAEPVAEGQSWPWFNESFTYHDAGTVTVPAGTFSDCWQATYDIGYTSYWIYCRGVGMVRSYTADSNGNGWDAVLVGKIDL